MPSGGFAATSRWLLSTPRLHHKRRSIVSSFQLHVPCIYGKLTELCADHTGIAHHAAWNGIVDCDEEDWTEMVLTRRNFVSTFAGNYTGYVKNIHYNFKTTSNDYGEPKSIWSYLGGWCIHSKMEEARPCSKPIKWLGQVCLVFFLVEVYINSRKSHFST